MKKSNMLTRIIVGVSLAALFIGIWFAIGFVGKSTAWYRNIIQIVAFAAVNVICVAEMKKVLLAKGLKTSFCPYVTAAVLPFLCTFTDTRHVAYIMILFITITAGAELFDKNISFESIFAEIALYIYPMIPILCLCRICTQDTVFVTQLAMLFTFACPLFGDTFAYFFGMAFGKKKLCERVSPKKTIAGSIGNIIGAGLAGFLCYLIQPMIAHLFSVTQHTVFSGLTDFVFAGLMLGIAGQIGDLFASSVKRWAGVKDFGNLFPGHGGMLDRIDSVLFCAPLVAVFLFI